MTLSAIDVWCATAASRAVHSVSVLGARALTWNETRRTRAILSRLSAHELNDIGLTRGDIENLR